MKYRGLSRVINLVSGRTRITAHTLLSDSRVYWWGRGMHVYVREYMGVACVNISIYVSVYRRFYIEHTIKKGHVPGIKLVNLYKRHTM